MTVSKGVGKRRMEWRQNGSRAAWVILPAALRMIADRNEIL